MREIYSGKLEGHKAHLLSSRDLSVRRLIGRLNEMGYAAAEVDVIEYDIESSRSVRDGDKRRKIPALKGRSFDIDIEDCGLLTVDYLNPTQNGSTTAFYTNVLVAFHGPNAIGGRLKEPVEKVYRAFGFSPTEQNPPQQSEPEAKEEGPEDDG